MPGVNKFFHILKSALILTVLGKGYPLAPLLDPGLFIVDIGSMLRIRFDSFNDSKLSWKCSRTINLKVFRSIECKIIQLKNS